MRDGGERRLGGERTNLPSELTSFQDRQSELGSLKPVVLDARLLSLVGTAGVGKTRLALELARSVQRRFPDGVWLVELAPVTEGRLLPGVIAGELRIPEALAGETLAALGDALSSRDMLVVLDGYDHLVDPVALTLEHLLHRCPKLKVLVTGRARIGLPGERVRRVQPLGVPDRDRHYTPAELEQVDAVAFFADRCRDVSADFRITPANVRDIVDLVRRLDGLPLALELAAAWTETLSPGELARELKARYRLLMARPVVSDRRTRLWAAIESGYDRLDPAAQSLFAQLAVFRDGWNLSAMTSVCRLESGATLPVLDRLVDHSFVTVTQAEEGPTRYRLLEVLRQFALARLDESGRHDATLRRFVDHMVSVAESAAASLSGPEGPGSFATLDAELDNLRSIFPVEAIWAAEPKRRLAVAMIPYWHSRGLFNEGRALLREAVAAMDAPTTATVTALSGLSWLSWAQGELGIAARCARAAFRAARRSGDRRAGAHALLRLAQARFDMGRPASAGRATRRASEIATELADDRLGAECILQLGQVALVEGRLEEAGGLLRDGVQRIARTGLADRRAMAVLVLGRLHLERGDLAEAESVLRQSLTEVRQLAMVRHSVPILETLAAVAEERGEHLRAARLAGAAEGLLEGMHARPPGTAPMRLLIVPRLTRARNAKDGEVAFAEGRRMDLPAAIAFALGESEPPAPPPPTRREPGRDVLTPRQLVVARSIAEGRTNKEIAARLGRSERTVEGHVEQILNKLTLNKRTQIATWVARGAAGQGRASPAP